MTSYRLTGNSIVLGGSQSGKSVKANEDYAKDPRIGVYFEPDGEHFVTGHAVSSIEEIQSGMAQGAKKFDWVAPMFDMDEGGQHMKLVKWLMLMGDRRNMGTVLVTDEAQHIAREGSRGTSLHLAVKRGKKRGLRNIVVTQEPRVFPNNLATLMDYYIYVGEISLQDARYYEENWDLRDASAWASNDPHEYCVIDRRGRIIDRGFSDVANFG